MKNQQNFMRIFAIAMKRNNESGCRDLVVAFLPPNALSNVTLFIRVMGSIQNS